MKFVSRFDSVQNPTLFTPWSIIHFFSGIIAGLAVRHLHLNFLWTLVLFMILNVFYEIKDTLMTDGENSWQNSIADVLSGVLGYLLVTKTLIGTNIILGLCTVLYIIFTSPISAEDGKSWSFFFDTWYTRG